MQIYIAIVACLSVCHWSIDSVLYPLRHKANTKKNSFDGVLCIKAMDREVRLKLLKAIGFTDTKCQETLKNEVVSQKLGELIQHVKHQ